MSRVNLAIKTKETELDFSGEGVQEGHIDQLIQGMFEALSVKAQKGHKETQLTEPTIHVHNTQEVVELDIEPAVSLPAKEFPTYIPNNTTIAGDPQTMEEALSKEKDDMPLHYKTGYKVIDGEKHYKCRYRCTKCRHAGNHYIPEGVKQVDCHECQTTMLVKKATPGSQGIQPDKFKNWFVAGDQMPVSEFVYGLAKRVE